MTLDYRILGLSEIDENYWQQQLQPILYEHSVAWLRATDKFVVDNQCKLHSLWQNDELIAALPLCEQLCAIGTKKLVNLTSFYSTETCVLTHKKHPEAAQTLLELIANNNPWHVIELGPLSFASQQLVLTLNKPIQPIAKQVNWFHEKIESEESYLSSRPSQLKNTIKRKNKQLAKLQHEYQFAQTDADLDRMFDDYITIYNKSWKGQEFSFDFIKQVCKDALAQNKLCFGLLTINESPAAAQIWFIGERCASIFKLAYDPEFKSLSVGTLLSEQMTKYVLSHHNVTHIEFGMGNEAYKKDWMNEYQVRQTYLIFNTMTVLGMIFWLRFSALVKVKHAIKGLLGNNKNGK
ncbi:GNAT family N-acetyltransferase [Colwelliaceae bacterium 6441]